MSAEPERPEACAHCGAPVLHLAVTRGAEAIVDLAPVLVREIPRGMGFLVRDGDGRGVPIGDVHQRVLGRSALGLRYHQCGVDA